MLQGVNGLKKLFWVAAVFAFLTGCSVSPSNNQNNSTSPLTNATGADLSTSQNNTGTNTTGLTDAQMKQTTSDLIARYVQSHNDASLADYKIDVEQFFTPGLATAIGSTAASGTDYAHAVQSSNTQIMKVQGVNSKQFMAISRIEINYKDGATTNQIYHLSFVNFGGNWIIKSIA